MKKKIYLLLFITCVFDFPVRGKEKQEYEISKSTAFEEPGNKRLIFKKVPLTPDCKYTLTFKGKFEGGEAIEENPRMALTLRTWGHCSYAFLPHIYFNFYDSEGKSISMQSDVRALPFRTWHTYSRIFYPPVGAAFMKLSIITGKKTKKLFLKYFSFKKTPDQSAININPVVNDSGLYDYSAWSNFAWGANLMRKADGKVGFNPAYGSTSASFPLKPNTWYRASGKGRVSGYAATMKLKMFDGKKLLDSISIRGKKFKTPANCNRGNIMVRSMVLDEVFVKEVKDKKKEFPSR